MKQEEMGALRQSLGVTSMRMRGSSDTEPRSSGLVAPVCKGDVCREPDVETAVRAKNRSDNRQPVLAHSAIAKARTTDSTMTALCGERQRIVRYVIPLAASILGAYGRASSAWMAFRWALLAPLAPKRLREGRQAPVRGVTRQRWGTAGVHVSHRGADRHPLVLVVFSTSF